MDRQALEEGIRNVPDFPKPGIQFKDITPILLDPDLFKKALDALAEPIPTETVDKIVGIDARGFIFGAALADRLNVGFIPVRKKGKLPYKTRSVAYTLEYGEAEIELHEDAVNKGDKIWLVDDLLATGGTARAAADLIEQMDGELLAMSFLVELAFLEGRKRLGDASPVHATLIY
ncbi:MAG: adenine phosphoribosyltransferase [Verrucomicrobiota bacterium]